MPQILRDNVGDSRVVDDVAALAAAYDDDAVAAASEAARQTRQEDLALLRELFARSDGPTDPWGRRVLAHLNRHRTYYAVAALVIAVVLFRSPEPLPLAANQDGGNVVIPTIDAQRAATAPATDVPLQFDIPETFSLPLDTVSDFAALTVIGTQPDPPIPVAPSVLRFAQTGYASSLGGTPVDQEPPSGGLPVEAIAGQVTKYSYARLSGAGTVLKLKALTGEGASVNPSQARVQLCQITTPNWRPSRGTSATDAPQYNKACIEGVAKSGAWTFTFSQIYNPLDKNGWAIVPLLDGNVTFRVTFAPTAV